MIKSDKVGFLLNFCIIISRQSKIIIARQDIIIGRRDIMFIIIGRQGH